MLPPTRRASRGALVIAVIGLGFLGGRAAAQGQLAGADDEPQTAVAQSETSDQVSQGEPDAQSSIRKVLPDNGDPTGFNKFLHDRGIEYSLTYIGEAMGNPTGGARRGAITQGRVDLQVDADLQTLAGWTGATFHANAYQIHGTGLSRYYLNNLAVVSGIEALPSTRLFELWLEQSFLDKRLSVRVGQLGADTEFLVSQTAGVFVNSTFGWPAITASNLPGGGPAYPLATPGIRVKVEPVKNLTVRVGVFNGDPAGANAPGPGGPDPQILNRNGTNFRLRDPAFLISEAAYAYNTEKDAGGLPGTVKLGYWHHFGRFADQELDDTGLSLADPNTSGIARRLRGNDGVYGIIDQSIYREPGKDDQGASAFVRVAASPSDRNLVSFYADAGIAYKGLVPGRPDDTAGLGVGYTQISGRDRALDRDVIFFTGQPGPVRRSEALLEATYQAVVTSGFTIQPDFQYIFRPGGGILNPRDPSQGRIRNAAVFGLRATVRY